MKIIDCAQLSEEWFAARRGVPTSSEFSRILTPKTGKLAAAAEEYARELVAERLCLIPPVDRPTNGAMRHGTEFEPEARRFFEFETGAEVQQVGFCLSDDGRFGCSPDGLIGDDGLLEMKCPQGKAHIGYLLDGELPADYRAQVHGQLIVTGRKYVQFLSYCPGLPPLLVKVEPDAYTETLRAALDQFHARLSEILERFTRRAA